MSINTFKFNRVVVIESLGNKDTKTGRVNAELLMGEIVNLNKTTPVELHACGSVEEFRLMISNLIEQSSYVNIPLLHIECHGDQEDGLVFKDLTEISWTELAEVLFPLNVKTGCGLMLCLSACHAASFLHQMGNFKVPCPCRILVAPTTEISPADCISGFRVFYQELFQSGVVASALIKIEETNFGEAKWLGEFAENWFEEVAKNHFLEYCSKSAIHERVLSMKIKLTAIGVDKPIAQVKKEMLQYLRENVVKTSYEKFFGIDEYPELHQKFSPIYQKCERWVQEMRQAGKLGF